jgi:Eukaryotic translation initiation factor 3 subunit 7 (eIF-3)
MTQSGPRQQTGQPTAPRPQFRSGGPSHMIDKTPKARPQDPGVQVDSANLFPVNVRLRFFPVQSPRLQITPEWELIETFDIPSLSKLAVNVPAVEDLKWTGRLAAYDAKVDLTTVARSRAVQSHPEKVHVYTRVKQDPTMMEMAVEGIAKVFVTDAVLAHLMTGNKTMNPWYVHCVPLCVCVDPTQ